MPSQWDSNSRYSDSGQCDYPVYTGSTTTANYGNTNLCGLASYLMALSLVPHHTEVAIPSSSSAKSRRLAELAKRYKSFDTSYGFFDYTQIARIANMANGTSYIKGEQTNWWDCNEKRGNQAILESTPPTNSGRREIKDFIISNLRDDSPVIAITTIRANYGSADNSNYISTNGGQGHFVVVVGVTEDDVSENYRIRFKDPWTDNSKTYEVDYSKFLNSMIEFNTNYNAIALIN